MDFMVYRNGKRPQLVTESTNYLDTQGSKEDRLCGCAHTEWTGESMLRRSSSVG